MMPGGHVGSPLKKTKTILGAADNRGTPESMKSKSRSPGLGRSKSPTSARSTGSDTSEMRQSVVRFLKQAEQERR